MRRMTQGPHQSLQSQDTTAGQGGQAEFVYSETVLNRFDKYLSNERLAAYLTQARGDKWVAIRLYERNTQISEALYGVVQGLEVCLRNAIHELLTSRLGAPDWYDHFPFGDPEKLAIEEAKKKIQERPAQISPGRMIAELSFSFWVRLFSHRYENELHFPHLSRIFPMKLKRAQIHDRLINLKTLRNRIAHHERLIYKRDPEKDYCDLVETIGWISPDVKDWVESTNCFRERFSKRLPRKPADPATD
jgi:hypothetical protein